MPSIINGSDNFNTSAAVGSRGQVFTSNGTFTLPAGVSAVKVTVVGGGGNSGAATTNSRFGIGGGGGGTAIKYLTGLTAGNTLSVTVGGAGGTSSVASGTESITTVSATGGATGGTNFAGRNQYALGGVGSSGDLNFNGGSSTATITIDIYVVVSAGGTSIFGGQKQAGTTDNSSSYPSVNATNYGEGGTGPWRGTTAVTVGTGFQGVVIFEW